MISLMLQLKEKKILDFCVALSLPLFCVGLDFPFFFLEKGVGKKKEGGKAKLPKRKTEVKE
jgi:hypothetical protein